MCSMSLKYQMYSLLLFCPQQTTNMETEKYHYLKLSNLELSCKNSFPAPPQNALEA